jgi:hypothetical protein
MANENKKKRLSLITQRTKKTVMTAEELRKKLKNLFRNHIGIDNSISPYEIFEEVFSRDPNEVDVFERNYLWAVLKRIMATMRTTNECFIVHRGIFNFFVLQSAEELKHFEKVTDNHIKTLKLHKKNARIWVEQGIWTRL